MKSCKSITFVWFLCKSWTLGYRGQTIPKIEGGGGGNNRNRTMHKCSWLRHLVYSCWMLMSSNVFHFNNCSFFSSSLYDYYWKPYWGILYCVVAHFYSTLNIWVPKTKWKCSRDFSHALIMMEMNFFSGFLQWCAYRQASHFLNRWKHQKGTCITLWGTTLTCSLEALSFY